MWLLRQPLVTSTVIPAIPRRLRWILRRLYFLPFDLSDRLHGDRDDMVPPKSAIFAGSVDGFKKSGEILARRLIDYGGLEPSSRILDVGSGMGRLAVALIPFMSDEGSYDGLDIVESGVTWCQQHITTKRSNFSFTRADVQNSEYNPKGRSLASEYRFPYQDESFDLVVAISVFTHMLPEDAEHYISEFARVLRPGGRCFATYFLINPDSLRLMELGRSALEFRHDLGSHWLVSRRATELSVGYEEQCALRAYETCGFGTSVHYGGWCGRAPFWSEKSGLGDQDVVLATKT